LANYSGKHQVLGLDGNIDSTRPKYILWTGMHSIILPNFVELLFIYVINSTSTIYLLSGKVQENEFRLI